MGIAVHDAVHDRDAYGFFFDNVMDFGLYSFDGIWPVGPKLEPDWTPFSFSETGLPSFFEYIKHR